MEYLVEVETSCLHYIFIRYVILFIVLCYVSLIIIKINDILARFVSTCVGYL